MALVLQTTLTTTIRRAPVQVMPAPTNDPRPGLVTDAARYRSIGSLQALALAVAAAVVTPVLLWLAL